MDEFHEPRGRIEPRQRRGRSDAVTQGRLRERLASLRAVSAILEPSRSTFGTAIDAILELDEQHQNELANVMFAATAEAGRQWTAWRFRCEEPDCAVGVVTYSQEWEPGSGLPVRCPLCGSALGDLELIENIGSDLE
jgi:hypothetical protein